jgi:hypothetical protein
MFDAKPTTCAPYVAAALALSLLGIPAAGSAGDTAATPAEGHAPTSMSPRQAVKAMAGMAGYYRVTPDGDTYLYPGMRLSADMHGMYGAYRVTQGGITLYPMGLSAQDLSMDSLGGVLGYFRVTPDNKVNFYPRPKEPTGMSGMTGRAGD